MSESELGTERAMRQQVRKRYSMPEARAKEREDAREKGGWEGAREKEGGKGLGEKREVLCVYVCVCVCRTRERERERVLHFGRRIPILVCESLNIQGDDAQLPAH